jgi:serine protease Do
MPSLRWCLSLSCVVLALLRFSPAISRPAPSSADLIAGLLPEVVNLSLTKYEKTPAAAGNMTSQPSIKEDKTQASGFIIDPSGLIITNRHAIADAADIMVILDDGTHLRGTVLAAATQSDIALLKVDAERPLHTVRFGNSDELRPGDPVYVIGNPFGFGSTVTSGIVSALDREMQESGAGSFIQIDAALNRGNSGGPVFNPRGELVGISTALYSPAPETGFVGIGYAIPSNDARFIIDQLRTQGHVRLGWIGGRVQPVTEDIAAAVGLSTPTGSIVLEVGDGTPAAHAGLNVGDIILKVDNRAAPKPLILDREIEQSPIGSTVALTIWRAGTQQVLQVTIGESPADNTGPKAGARVVQQEVHVARDDLGLVVGPITEEITRRLGLAAVPSVGVAVRGVVANSVAADHGVGPGMLLLNINHQPVTSSADVQQWIDTARHERRSFILLLLEGESGLRWVSLPLPP